MLNSLELISAQTPAIHICLKCPSLSLALASKEYGIKCQKFMLNEMTKYKFHFTLVLFQLIDTLHNPKIKTAMSFSTLLSNTNGFDDVFFYLFPDFPRKKFR